MRPVRVLIVDDSATIRGILTAVLSRDPEIEVVGAAPEPAVARQMIKDLNPDVITLDVEMPNMNGIEFLDRIMRLRPMPVVMISTLTQRGTEVTLEALELGAVDYYPKPTDNVQQILNADGLELATKVKAAAGAQLGARATKTKNGTQIAVGAGYTPGNQIVAIGSSTGGVEALNAVLSRFPENCPPTLITQHMPEQFTKTFAARLDSLYGPKITEAEDGALLEVGRVYLAPGGATHLEVGGMGKMRCKLVRKDLVSGHRPSVDVLFRSMAETVGKRGVGVILTGMGGDGAQGLKLMRDKGATTIGQDAATSLIYGMPRVAFEMGAVQRQLPLDKISTEILRLCKTTN